MMRCTLQALPAPRCFCPLQAGDAAVNWRAGGALGRRVVQGHGLCDSLLCAATGLMMAPCPRLFAAPQVRPSVWRKAFDDGGEPGACRPSQSIMLSGTAACSCVSLDSLRLSPHLSTLACLPAACPPASRQAMKAMQQRTGRLGWRWAMWRRFVGTPGREEGSLGCGQWWAHPERAGAAAGWPAPACARLLGIPRSTPAPQPRH